MATVRRSVSLIQKCTRQFGGSPVLRTEIEIPKPRKQFLKMKRLQRKFQIEDGVPIYLKAGFRDKLLFNATLLGVGVGLVMSVHTLITLMNRR